MCFVMPEATALNLAADVLGQSSMSQSSRLILRRPQRAADQGYAGLKAGIIHSMAGSGSVVTSAGLVFATTMASFVVSDLRILGQVGTTIGLGLLFDTLIVRSFMTPSIAALLGRWFWWPQRVRPRPASSMLRPYGPRPAVRQLLLWEDGDSAVTSHDRVTSG
jgi:putative drug exporter of the RND superfamily